MLTRSQGGPTPLCQIGYVNQTEIMSGRVSLVDASHGAVTDAGLEASSAALEHCLARTLLGLSRGLVARLCGFVLLPGWLAVPRLRTREAGLRRRNP